MEGQLSDAVAELFVSLGSNNLKLALAWISVGAVLCRY